MNNLNLIIGTDNKLITFYLQSILDKINYNTDNKIVYDLDNNTISDIIDEASMPSLFSGKKVIIGTNFDINKLTENDIEYLNKYFKNINKDAYIILICGSIDARRSNYKIFKEAFNIIDTSKISNSDDFREHINNYLKEKKYIIDDIDYFISKVGNDLNNINSELDKLMLYKEQDKRITNADIDLLIIDNIDSVIYEFTNAFLEDDTNKIVKMYNNFKLENITIDYLIASLANTIRQALIVKILKNDNKSNSEIAKAIGKKEFYVKKLLERIYMYSERTLASYINKLALIDRNIKLGISSNSDLELFLIDKNK